MRGNAKGISLSKGLTRYFNYSARQCMLMHPIWQNNNDNNKSNTIFRDEKWSCFILMFNLDQWAGRNRKVWTNRRWQSIRVDLQGGVTVQWCLWGWWANTISGPRSSQPQWIGGRGDRGRQESEPNRERKPIKDGGTEVLLHSWPGFRSLKVLRHSCPEV